MELRVSKALTFSLGFQRFAQAMVDRLIFGRYRYGLPQPNPAQDYLKRLKGAVRDYERTGNTERLVDAANYACLEFQCPLHPRAHFKSEESGGRRVTVRELAG